MALISFPTGTDSPVRGASSHRKEWFSTNLASAGILSPASRSKISPGTSSFDGTSSSLPPLRSGDRRRKHLLQGLQGALCTILLDKPEDSTEDDDDSNDGCIDHFTDQGRKNNGNEKDDDEDIFELVEEEGEGRNLFLLFSVHYSHISQVDF